MPLAPATPRVITRCHRVGLAALSLLAVGTLTTGALVASPASAARPSPASSPAANRSTASPFAAKPFTAATPSASLRGHSPIGRATVRVSGTTAHFVGWAVDLDAPRVSVAIISLVDGLRVSHGRTHQARPAITKRYHASPTPGFRLRITVPTDGYAHTACAAARNIGGGSATVLSCATLPAYEPAAVTDHDPYGWTVGTRHGDTLQFYGRATDPDFLARAETVVLYVDGWSAETLLTHHINRRTVGGPNAGFSASVTVTGGRSHVGCVWAVNVGPGSNRLIGCARFDLKSHARDLETRAEARMENAVVALAKKQFGKPYVWGDEGPNAFDCSGLVQWTYKRNGFLPLRVAEDQFGEAHMIPRSHARPGDLVFYYNTEGFVHHVGIYVRPGMTIAAMSPSMGIGYQAISWTPNYDGSGVSFGSFTHT